MGIRNVEVVVNMRLAGCKSHKEATPTPPTPRLGIKTLALFLCDRLQDIVY